MKNWLNALALGILALPCGSTSATAQGSAHETSHIQWVVGPSAINVADFYPPLAATLGMNGEVSLDCAVQTDQRLDCTVLSESMPGRGFGDAAMRIAGRLRATSDVPNYHVRIPVRFMSAAADQPVLPVSFTITSSPALDLTPMVYPEVARRAETPGFAQVICVARSDLHFDCAIEREEPANQGFGDAALRDAIRFIADTHTIPPRGSYAFTARYLVYFRPGAAQPLKMGEAFPLWDQMPQADDISSSYPSAARRARSSGFALLTCRIRADRRLDCLANFEMPHRSGFTTAARRLSQLYRIAPDSFGTPGFAIDDTIALPVVFDNGATGPLIRLEEHHVAEH